MWWEQMLGGQKCWESRKCWGNKKFGIKTEQTRENGYWKEQSQTELRKSKSKFMIS